MSISMARHRIRSVSSGVAAARRVCTAAPPAAAEKNTKPLYRRLSALRGDPKGSISSTMEGWMKEGRPVSGSQVMGFVRQLRKYRDFKHALELIEWRENRGMDITVADRAVYLDLISKVHGINKAEDYFSNLPLSDKNQKTYAALLAGYCQQKMADKAIALYEKMKQLDFASTALVNNNLMTLYLKLGQPEQVIAHFQEIKAANISPDRVTYSLLISSYASLNDIDSAERVVEEMKEGGQVAPNWSIYCSLAAIYNSAALHQKSKSALKTAEELVNRYQRTPYEYIISLYAAAGNSEEVKRVWKLVKDSFNKITNNCYFNMFIALRKLGDLDGLKQCFQEWEASCKSYDVKLVNAVVDAYLRNDKPEEAEALWKKAVMIIEKKGVGSDYRMLEMFIDFYLKRPDLGSAMKYLEVMRSKGWKPGKQNKHAFLKYFEEVKDVDGAEKFCRTLKQLGSLDAGRTNLCSELTWPLVEKRVLLVRGSERMGSNSAQKLRGC